MFSFRLYESFACIIKLVWIDYMYFSTVYTVLRFCYLHLSAM